MKLHALNVILFMADAHDHAVGQFGGNRQAIRQTGPIENQRMVPADFDILRHSGITSLPVVMQPGYLPMDDFTGANDLAPESFANGLMSQANAQHRNRSG